jgi:hypothetical protein
MLSTGFPYFICGQKFLSKSGSKLIQIISPIEWEKLGTVVWDPADRMDSGD